MDRCHPEGVLLFGVMGTRKGFVPMFENNKTPMSPRTQNPKDLK
jgi:hypothetical protein